MHVQGYICMCRTHPDEEAASATDGSVDAHDEFVKQPRVDLQVISEVIREVIREVISEAVRQLRVDLQVISEVIREVISEVMSEVISEAVRQRRVDLPGKDHVEAKVGSMQVTHGPRAGGLRPTIALNTAQGCRVTSKEPRADRLDESLRGAVTDSTTDLPPWREPPRCRD